MPLLRSFKIFFWFPASVMLFGFPCLRGAVRQGCVTPLYVRFTILLKRSECKSLLKNISASLLIIFLITQKTNAQSTDTAYIDSNAIDKIRIENVEAPAVDFNDDDYEDTTEKHIYDTSQYFFNFKGYPHEPYTTGKITQRHLIDAEVKKLKTEDDFWYIPAIEKLQARLKNDPKFRDSLLHAKQLELLSQNNNTILQQPWFNTFLWIIIVGVFIAAIIYFLLQNKINLFSTESAASGNETKEDEHEDIFNLSYTRLIQNSEKEKNYRVAVRLMFLQLLKLLSETNNIQYQPDYTDLDYLKQLDQTKYYNEFFKVMRSYEYAWYGKFNISPELYNAIKNDFLRLQHRII